MNDNLVNQKRYNMEFSIKNGNPEKQKADCVIVGVFEERKLSESAKIIDATANKAISAVLKTGDFEGKLNATLVLHGLTGIAATRVMLVGLGKQAEFSEKQYRQAVRTAVKAMPAGVANASFYLTELAIKKSDVQAKVAQLVEVAMDATYQVNAIKQKKVEPKTLAKIAIIVEKAENAAAETGLKHGLAIGHGVNLAKDLGNLPPNICTPTYLGEQAKKLAKQYGFKVEVLEQKEIEKLGMGSFLGVAQGSVEPPRFIILQHLKGKKGAKPTVLVGKGITFDTGGISLKPGGDMDEMKYDMCGAASVLGTFKAIGELGLAINAVGLIATCENMPDAGAIKPGDILTSMSGLTIEVLNTDAEGRLILCDALTYAERFEPSAVVDIATLTGACVIALGHHPSGLFSNKDALAAELLVAG
jgi:leucyl aminopeptidase